MLRQFIKCSLLTYASRACQKPAPKNLTHFFVTFPTIHHYTTMRGLTVLLALLLSLALHSQQEDVFAVKKNNTFKTGLQGFYCSDYMTDGRACYYFDSLHYVVVFSSSANLQAIPQDYTTNIKGRNTEARVPYTQHGDTIRFTITRPVITNNQPGLLVTEATGLLANDRIYFTLTTRQNAGTPTTRTHTVKKL